MDVPADQTGSKHCKCPSPQVRKSARRLAAGILGQAVELELVSLLTSFSSCCLEIWQRDGESRLAEEVAPGLAELKTGQKITTSSRGVSKVFENGAEVVFARRNCGCFNGAGGVGLGRNTHGRLRQLCF
jgi:hypothetical protein